MAMPSGEPAIIGFDEPVGPVMPNDKTLPYHPSALTT